MAKEVAKPTAPAKPQVPTPPVEPNPETAPVDTPVVAGPVAPLSEAELRAEIAMLEAENDRIAVESRKREESLRAELEAAKAELSKAAPRSPVVESAASQPAAASRWEGRIPKDPLAPKVKFTTPTGVGESEAREYYLKAAGIVSTPHQVEVVRVSVG